MIKAEQFAEKIKQKYPEYKDVDNYKLAQTMVSKYPAYKDKVDFHEGFIDTTKRQVGEGVSTMQSGAGDIWAGLTQGKPGLASGGVADIIGGGLQTAFAPLAGGIEQIPILREVTHATMGAVNDASLFAADKFIEGLEFAGFEQTEDSKTAIRKHFTNGANLGIIRGSKLKTYKNLESTISKTATDRILPQLEKVKTGAKLDKIAPIFEQSKKVLVEELPKHMASKASGLMPETIKQLVKRPELVEKLKTKDLNTVRTETFKSIVKDIDAEIARKAETGKAYGVVRSNKTKVDMGKNWLENKLKEAGLKFKEKKAEGGIEAEFQSPLFGLGKTAEGKAKPTGKLEATMTSEIRNPAEIGALQKLYGMYKGNKYTGKSFLNLRTDLARLAKYDKKMSTDIQRWAADTRAELNSKGRGELKGLEALDRKYTKITEELEPIKKLIYDEKGNIKDSAVNAVLDVVKKGKEARLEKIEKVSPNIKKRLEELMLFEDLTRGMARRPSITGLGMFGLGFSTGSLPLLMSSFATHPSILIPALATFGKAKGKSKAFVDGVSAKVKNNQTLTTMEKDFVAQTQKMLNFGKNLYSWKMPPEREN